MNQKLSFTFWSALGYAILFLIVTAFIGAISYVGAQYLNITNDLSWFLTFCILVVACILITLYIYKKSEVNLSLRIFKKYNNAYIIPTLIIAIGLRIIGGTLTQILAVLVPMSESLKNQLYSSTFANPILSFISLCVLVPILEELFFKAVIAEGLSNYYNQAKTIIYSTFIFAASHLNIYQFVAAFLLGSFACYVYLKTKNILLPILVHIVWNGFDEIWVISPLKEHPITALTDILSTHFLVKHVFATLLIVIGCILLKKIKQSPIKAIVI